MAKRQNKKTEIIEPQQLDTYFKQRMYQMGITNTSDHYFIVPGDYPSPNYKQPIFAETPEGNISIHYPSLFGGAEFIAGTEVPFTRLRYNPDNQPADKPKYIQAAGSGLHIFFPPALVEKFTNKVAIPKLYITEGENKAMAASIAGMDIIGLGGKDSFRNEDKTGLHPDIIRMISECNIETLVMLTDADTLAVKWDPEDEEQKDKDLSKTLWGFRTTAINFREACINAGVKDCYFGFIKLALMREPINVGNPDRVIKGLDDLLESRREANAISYIINDLDRLTAAKAFFEIYNVGAMQPVQINKIFYLNPGRGGVPSSFYAANAELLRNHPFKFRNAVYQNNTETGLECIKHADSGKYIRIGCDYFKMIEIPDGNGVMQPQLEGWKAGEIMRDFGKNFFNGIEKYDANCNVPCNTAAYQKVINGCYNRYYPLSHSLVDGPFPIITDALKHLFGERELVPADGDKPALTSFDLIMDYITILYNFPQQPLPIVVLYSAEGNTGKSTGIWLLEDIFLANYTEVTNDIFEDNMNDDWATKLVIGMDEGFIEKNKVYQKIKSLSTAHMVMMRGMYSARKRVPFFGKIWITTNDKGFIKLEKKETRFWINEVPVLEKIDPDIRGKMQNEIPAFLYHLSNRELKFPKVSRHWFAPELLVTEMGNQVKENSKGWLEQELETIIVEKFFHYRWHSLYYTQEEMVALLNGQHASARFRSADIKKQMWDKYGMKTKLNRWKQPNEPDVQDGPLGITFEKHKRCYEFRIEDFVPMEQIKDELGDLFDIDEIIVNRATSAKKDGDDDLPF
ncbi:MAG: primase-helicase family protein [Mucilaginibacter sp.]